MLNRKEKRKISGLLWAAACPRPSCIPMGRLRGVQAEGLRYEKALAGQIEGSLRGQWFSFEDANGRGFCQPDIILWLPQGLYVIECKLSWTPEARESLEGLYLPVLRKASGAEVVGLVACENLKRGIPWTTRVVSTLDAALSGAYWPGSLVLHWRRGWPLTGSQKRAT